MPFLWFRFPIRFSKEIDWSIIVRLSRVLILSILFSCLRKMMKTKNEIEGQVATRHWSVMKSFRFDQNKTKIFSFSFFNLSQLKLTISFCIDLSRICQYLIQASLLSLVLFDNDHRTSIIFFSFLTELVDCNGGGRHRCSTCQFFLFQLLVSRRREMRNASEE